MTTRWYPVGMTLSPAASSAPLPLDGEFAVRPFTFIPVGVSRTRSKVGKGRTPDQRATVARIVSLDEFDHAANNPLEDDPCCDRCNGRVGPVWMFWFDVFNSMHATQIGPDGSVMKEFIGPMD